MFKTDEELWEGYKDMINECLPEWATPRRDAATNMEEQDKLLFLCGFDDYVDSLAADDLLSDELKKEYGYD